MTTPNRIERIFERMLWKFRLFTLLPVIFGLISSLTFFILGSLEVIEGIVHKVSDGGSGHLKVEATVSMLIGGIDNYLIGVVLLIFSFGIYELFISPLDIRDRYSYVQVLKVTSLEELKSKILAVIVMALVVSFFKKAVTASIDTSADMLVLAASILIISLSGYLLALSHRDHSTHRSE